MHTNYSLTDLSSWGSALLDYILHPFITIILCLLSVFVVLGNLLVVSAIWHENQLHSVTNYLIASLAAADCLVGAVVMPSSIISEIIVGSWTFGPTWCDLWHSFDVLASTASIMNLCAISLDRYLAITNPISYPTKMTPKRVALLIVSLWTCSSLISFPAIAWWRAVGKGPLQQLNSATTTTTISPMDSSQDFLSFQTNLNQQEVPLYRCVFTDDTYYLLFSSIVSFYGPLCVMLYAYYRIYKAAVQQTRFLKYGSKQVMIGGNKRNKKFRHFSEHSNHGTNEKCGLSEATCDGVSTTENYDTHLVLRAHRGGGGGSGNCTSISSKVVNAESVNNMPKADQRQQVSSTNSDSIMKLTVDGECEEQRGNFSSVDLDQINYSGVDKTKNANQIGFAQDSSNRRNRIGWSKHKRTKLQINSQRFDSNPIDEIAAKIKCSTESNDELISPKLIDQKDLLAHNISGKKERVSQTTSKTTTNNHDIRAHHNRNVIGKPLLASIRKQSNDVGLSILERPLNIGNTLPSAQKNLSSSYRNDIADQKSGHYHQKDLNITKFSRNKLEEKDNQRGLKIVDENETFEDINESESASTSSDSYGTGSIASVLVRPPQISQKSLDQKIQMKRSCDTIDSHLSNTKLRRALSVGGIEHKIPKSNVDIESGVNINEVNTSGRTSRSRASSHLFLGNKHRASDNSALGGTNVVFDFKNAKTLDIRSWIKITRSRSRKNNEIDRETELMKPPPSLVPLMMMNSDTSTDSSIVATEARRSGEENSDTQYNSVTYPEARSRIDTVHLHETTDSVHVVCKTAKSFQTTSSLKSSSNWKKKQSNELGRNLSFKDDSEKSKVQMLYYDSDKLIQSIVDLTDIHYIDCSNQSAHNSSNAIILCSTGHSNSEPVNEVQKLNLGTADQGQLADEGRITSVPRQRSVGKKLTKLAKERKAAKTLGIVVGVFILCWLPFFVVNIVVAFCGTDCIYRPQILVSIVTWLGWLNSAMNPVIYACWSRDFRRAFRRVLCTWVEFLYPYDGGKLARKLGLKRSSNYSNTHEAHLNRTASSTKCTTTSTGTIRSGVSIETTTRANGGHRSLLSDH